MSQNQALTHTNHLYPASTTTHHPPSSQTSHIRSLDQQVNPQLESRQSTCMFYTRKHCDNLLFTRLASVYFLPSQLQSWTCCPSTRKASLYGHRLDTRSLIYQIRVRVYQWLPQIVTVHFHWSIMHPGLNVMTSICDILAVICQAHTGISQYNALDKLTVLPNKLICSPTSECATQHVNGLPNMSICSSTSQCPTQVNVLPNK